MRELDMVLDRFMALDYPQLATAAKPDFEALLEQDDPELHAWILGRQVPPARFASLIEALQRHRQP